MRTVENDKYLLELSRSYPTRRSALSEVINLNAILNLPKGTEHFMSDIHGEHEAYLHIRRNASGAIKNKVDTLFAKSITAKERAELATLIYGKPGYEIGVTSSPLNLILYPDQYITEERAYELWNAFGYDTAYFSYNPSSAEERHVLSENGKLYCLIETSV